MKQLRITQILEYREKAKDSHAAWITEVNRAAAAIGNIDGNISSDEIVGIIAMDFAPRVIEHKNEMCAIRDDMFADVIKKIARGRCHLSLAYLSGAITLFASALAPAVPDIVDYFKDKRDIQRKNAMSFLIKLSQDA